MKSRTLTACFLGLLSAVAQAGDKAKPARVSFAVSGVECPACVYVIQQALIETKGVSDAEVIQMLESDAKVSFDPTVISEHQIAQAVREAIPLHGMPYVTTLKLRIPDYSEEVHAAKVTAVFARWMDWVTIEALDQRKGEFVIRFLPLEKDAHRPGPQGWSLAQLTQALKAPSPKGLGLDFEVVQPEP